jgi:hypothetical protein
MARRVHHLESHLAAEIDFVAVLQRTPDAPLATELLLEVCLPRRNLRVIAREAQAIATVLRHVTFAIGVWHVSRVHVNSGTRCLLHLSVAPSVIEVHVRVDDEPQVGRIPTQLFERRQQRGFGDTGCPGVDERPAWRVDQVAADHPTIPEWSGDLKYARADGCGEFDHASLSMLLIRFAALRHWRHGAGTEC